MTQRSKATRSSRSTGGALRRALGMLAFAGEGWDFWASGINDYSFGYYGTAGIYFKVGDRFNIGMDGRIVRGTSIALEGREGDADYEQVSLLMGISWGD